MVGLRKEKISVVVIASYLTTTRFRRALVGKRRDVQTGRVYFVKNQRASLSPEFIDDDFIRVAWKFDGSINRWCISVDSVGPP